MRFELSFPERVSFVGANEIRMETHAIKARMQQGSRGIEHYCELDRSRHPRWKAVPTIPTGSQSRMAQK